MSEVGRELHLVIRTPTEVVVDQRVYSVTAEDTSGRFGLLPGAEPVLSVLVPSVLTYRSARGAKEQFVAVARGFLQLEKGHVHVSVRTALPCDSLETVREVLVRSTRHRRAGESAMHQAFEGLQQRLYLHLIEEERAR